MDGKWKQRFWILHTEVNDGQGKEGANNGFRIDKMCQINSTPTPISNSEWMFKKKKKTKTNQTDQAQSDAIQSQIDRDFQIQGLNSDHEV